MAVELFGPVAHRTVQRWRLRRGLKQVVRMLEYNAYLEDHVRLALISLINEANVTLAENHLDLESLMTIKTVRRKVLAGARRTPTKALAEGKTSVTRHAEPTANSLLVQPARARTTEKVIVTISEREAELRDLGASLVKPGE